MALILIVDDASLIRTVAKKAAQSIGHEVITATDGAKGVEAAKKYKFDLIFADINMPVMDGFTMIKQIKELQNNRYTPMVIFTTENSDQLKKQGRKIGVKAWLVKPFNQEKFITSINKLVV